VYETKTGLLTKKVTWKGISKAKFSEITQDTIHGIVNEDDEDEETAVKMYELEIWKRSKSAGVSIEKDCSKILSIKEY
jgi:hypothetical protein